MKTKIIVIHSSPKASRQAVTAKYIEFLAARYSKIKFSIHSVLGCVRNPEKLSLLIQDLENAHAVIWETPVHVYLIPGILQRFLYLIEEKQVQNHFKGFHSTVITTSIRVFDYAAHRHLNYISCRWGMKFHRGYSAEMYDLSETRKRNNFSNFFELFLFHIEKNHQGLVSPVEEFKKSDFKYLLPSTTQTVTDNDQNVVIIKDTSNNINLNNMIEKFQSTQKTSATIIDFEGLGYNFPFCTGCVHCMIDKCSRSDNFHQDIIEPILTADILIFSLDIGELGTTWRFEVILDRLLAAGHGPYLEKHPVVGFFTSSDLNFFHYLQDRFRAYFEQKGASTVEFVMPEPGSPGNLTAQIMEFAVSSSEIVSREFSYPKSFLAKGADFISRDFVYSMRGVLPVDLAFYRKHKLFNYPHRRIGNQIKQAFLTPLLKMGKMKKWVNENSMKIVLGPLDTIIKKEKRRSEV